MATQSLTDIQLRTAASVDVPAIAAFIQPFVDAGKILPRTCDELEEHPDNFFIVEHAGAIVGVAALDVYCQKLAEVRSLCVAESVRGLGVGRMLVEACVVRAKTHNILEVMAITCEDDFFKACGFDYTLTGEKRAVFYQTRE